MELMSSTFIQVRVVENREERYTVESQTNTDAYSINLPKMYCRPQVIAFDIAPPDAALQDRFTSASSAKSKITTVVGDLTSESDLSKAVKRKGVTVVYHIGALVGPFHDKDKLMMVNYQVRGRSCGGKGAGRSSRISR